MSAPTFRIADAGDAAALAEFMSRNFLAAYGECSSPRNIAATIGKHYGLQAQQRQLADRTRVNLVMESEGAIAGHAQLRLFGDRRGDVRGRRAVAVGGEEIARHECRQCVGILRGREAEAHFAHFSTKARSNT